MKKVLLFFLLLSVATELFAQIPTAEQLGKSFLEALKNKNFTAVIDLMPPQALYRKLSPSETLGKSEEDLKLMIDISTQRLEENFQKIISEAKRSQIYLEDFSFEKVKTESIPFIEPILFGMEVHYRYLLTGDKFHLIVAKDDKKWYLLEIAKSISVFDNLD